MHSVVPKFTRNLWFGLEAPEVLCCMCTHTRTNVSNLVFESLWGRPVTWEKLMMESDVAVLRIVSRLYINELEEEGPQHGMASSYLVLGQSCSFPFGTMSLVFIWIQCYNLNRSFK